MIYNLTLKSEQTGISVAVSINFTEDYVVLSTQNELEENQKYYYTVAAINSFGTVSSHQDGSRKYFCE